MGANLAPLLREDKRFSAIRYSAGGTRVAHDLGKVLHLPAPPETLFSLTRNNAGAFVEEFGRYFGEERPLWIFNKEQVNGSKYGKLTGEFKVFNVDSRYGWTHFRHHAVLSKVTFDQSSGKVSLDFDCLMGAPQDYHTQLKQEIDVNRGLVKVAFLRRNFPENINVERILGAYISTGSFSHRSEFVYMLQNKDE